MHATCVSLVRAFVNLVNDDEVSPLKVDALRDVLGDDDLAKLIWQIASPKWRFDDATFDRIAKAFENRVETTGCRELRTGLDKIVIRCFGTDLSSCGDRLSF